MAKVISLARVRSVQGIGVCAAMRKHSYNSAVKLADRYYGDNAAERRAFIKGWMWGTRVRLSYQPDGAA